MSTPGPPGSPSSGRNSRPSMGSTPRVAKNRGETHAAGNRSASPGAVTVPGHVKGVMAETHSKDSAWSRMS